MTRYLFLLIFRLLWAKDQLVYVIEYGRHGARYPEPEFLPWNKAPMDLTVAGMRQQYLLGRALRKRYGNFLDAQYDPRQISVRSTFKDRTINSAYARVMGLYSAKSNSKITQAEAKRAVPPNAFDYGSWAKELGSDAVNRGKQIVPVSIVGYDNDYLLEPKIACPSLKFVTGKHKQANAKEIQAFHDSNRELYSALFKTANISEKDYRTSKILKVRNSIECGLHEGKLAVSSKHAQELLKNSTFIYYHLKFDHYQKVSYGNYKVSKLMATPFLRHVGKRLLEVASEGAGEKKYEMYVASDTLFHSLLLQLDYYPEIETPFSSAIYFELYRARANSYYVNVTFNRDASKRYAVEEFGRLVESVTYGEKQFCEYCRHYDFPTPRKIVWVILGGMLSSLLLLGYILLGYLKRYQGRSFLKLDYDI